LNKKALLFSFLALFVTFYQACAMETIPYRNTTALQRLATLLHEQQYFVESIDAMESNPIYPFEQLNKNVGKMVRYASYLAESDMADHKKQIKSLGKSFHPDHLCIAHACTSLKEDKLYTDIKKGLLDMPQEQLLESLRSLVARLESYISMNVTDPGFVEVHAELYKELRPLCEKYQTALPGIKRYYDAILQELMKRQRKGVYSMRSHSYANRLLPEAYQISPAYLSMLEAQSIKQVTSLLTADKHSPQPEEKTVQPKKRKSAKPAQPIVTAQQTIDMHDIYALQEYLFPGSLIPKF